MELTESGINLDMRIPPDFATLHPGYRGQVLE
jgi:hypothetical protein